MTVVHVALEPKHTYEAIVPAPLRLLLLSIFSYSQPVPRWEAYNDYRPSDLTHVNATVYDLRVTDEGGPLRNISTGEDLAASVRVVVESEPTEDFGAISAPINPGSPAHRVFNGYVDTGGPDNFGLPGIRSSLGTKLILVFENLDPTKRYNFRGTVARAGGYVNRWSFFGITGAESYVTAHQDGSANQNLFTEATFPAGTLETNEVALNTGHNIEGSLVAWDNIDPGADGAFEIVAQQYIGPAPFGDPAAAAGQYGYGLNAIYLAEVESTGNLKLTENPANQNVPAGQTATLRVVAESPQTITYQWQRAAPGTTSFVDIPDATQATYTTPVLAAADSGSKFRVRLVSGGAQTTSGEAELLVDATIPTVSAVRGSVNLNAAHVSFSEPMKLTTLSDTNNFQFSGGLTVSSAIPLDSQIVRLLTSPQTAGTRYTLTLKDLEDVAGNKVAANATLNFNAFNVTTNVVGVEIWNAIIGSAVQDLRNDPRYPGQPDEDYILPTFDSFLLPVLTNADRNTYGGRMRAWLTPEETAEYEFFIRADNQGELRISTDDKFENLDNPDIVLNELPAAADTVANDPFQEPGIDSSTSAPIRLEAGRRYALQALWKEANGGDHLQVAWRKVGDTTLAEELQPIPSRFLSYYGPVSSTVEEPAISISRDAGAIRVQWSGGVLQSSTDLRTWTDETSATSPRTITVTPGERRFFRVKG